MDYLNQMVIMVITISEFQEFQFFPTTVLFRVIDFLIFIIEIVILDLLH